MDVLTLFANPGFQNISASAILVLVVVMILTGRLVPRSVSDAWKDAYYKERAAGEVKDQHITALVSAATTSARALDALPKAGGEPDAADTATSPGNRAQG